MDETEIRLFLRDGYPRLVGAVALVTGDFTTAEDAVQEAVARAWERSERGETIVALVAIRPPIPASLDPRWTRRPLDRSRSVQHIAVHAISDW